jgi:hypothetical protein
MPAFIGICGSATSCKFLINWKHNANLMRPDNSGCTTQAALCVELRIGQR